jgi:hypothetical protein
MDTSVMWDSVAGHHTDVSTLLINGGKETYRKSNVANQGVRWRHMKKLIQLTQLVCLGLGAVFSPPDEKRAQIKLPATQAHKLGYAYN